MKVENENVEVEVESEDSQFLATRHFTTHISNLFRIHRQETSHQTVPFSMAGEDSPSLGGPQSAERSSLVGKLCCGGLGKPLERGEGELSITESLCTRNSAFPVAQ